MRLPVQVLQYGMDVRDIVNMAAIAAADAVSSRTAGAAEPPVPEPRVPEPDGAEPVVAGTG
jgi:hypothetical protein